VDIVSTVRAIILKPDQALKLKAKDDCKDYEGNPRKAGSEWLVKRAGPYLPNVLEEVVEITLGHIVSDKVALHLRAKSTFVDSRGVKRKAGSEWLVTNEFEDTYIPDVHEEVTTLVNLIILTDKDFCVIKDPVDETGIPKLGYSKLVKGPCSFFLKPGESLSGNVSNSIILSEGDALQLSATEEFIDDYQGKKKRRRPGDVWFSYGPGEYWPPVQVNIKSRISAFLKVEPLGLYYYQPSLFFGSLFGGLVIFFILLKYVNLFFGEGDPKGDL